MSTLMLVGFADPEAAAIEMMLERNRPDLRCHTVRRSADDSISTGIDPVDVDDCCLVNLAGMGLLRPSAENTVRLLELLAGRSAVLVRSKDEDWLTAPLALAPQQELIWLSRPFTSAGLRDALQRLRPVSVSGSAVKHVQGHPAPAINGSGGLASAAIAAPGLGSGGFEQLLETFPVLRNLQIFRLAGEVLKAPGGHELQLGASTFVMDFRAGWLASGFHLSPAVMKMLNQRFSELRLQPLAPGSAEARLKELFPGDSIRVRRPLDVIVWELASHALVDVTLEAKQDFSIRLRRFPNFPQLVQVAAPDVQLATLCAHAPQSIHTLLRAFPGQAQAVYRFAVLTVLCGQAVMLPEAVPAAETGLVAGSGTASATDQVSRGFLKQLLDRLF